MNKPTTKPQTGGENTANKTAKHKTGGKTGKRKNAQSRYKDPSQMWWDLCPVFAYDVKDVNKPNKYVLLITTSILWCFSIVTVCIGAHLIIQRKHREEAISAASFSDFWLNISLVLLCNGLVSSIITFCGLVGVLRENIALIRVFYISLIAVLLLRFGLAVFVFVFADYSRPLLENLMAEQAVVDYRASSDVETLMDYLQTTFHCCGLRDDGFQDWSRNIYFNCSAANPSPERCGVPWSCCRNHTGISNALCGLGVQKLDRNIASRVIHTIGCLHAIQLWVFSHAVTAGLVGLFEITVIVAVTFQCTRMVNELQMMNGVYRGPWWLGASRRNRLQTKRKTMPPGTSSEPAKSPRSSPGPSAQPRSTEPPSDSDQERTKRPSVLKIGHGPAVRRTKAAPKKGKSSDLSGTAHGKPQDEASNQPLGEASSQALDEITDQQPSEIFTQPPSRVLSGHPSEASNQPTMMSSSHHPSEIFTRPPSRISTQVPGQASGQEPGDPPTIVVLDSDGRVIGERVLATTFVGVADS